MRITILGTSSGLTVLNRHASAYLVQAGDSHILLDAGENVTRQLLRNEADPNMIDAVFISHTHPDHVAGLFSLLVYMHLTERNTPLTIHVPQGVRMHIQNLLPVFRIFRQEWSFPFKVDAIVPGKVFEAEKSSFSLLALPNTHLSGSERLAEKMDIGSDSYSFRLIEDQKSMVYTSDVPSLQHLRSPDTTTEVLLTECTHIGIDEIVAFALENNIPRVFLTHIPPDLENAALPKTEGGSIVFAEEGTIIEV